jgi:transposase
MKARIILNANIHRDVNAAINILSIAKGGKGISLGRSHSKTDVAGAIPAVAVIA